jgi:DNA-binding MarR family transcriptional regulator
VDEFPDELIEAGDSDDGMISSLLLIGKTTRAIVGYRLIELGLFVGQDDLIIQLDPLVPKNVGEVAEDLNIRPSTVSKTLDRLFAAGLVTRTRNPNDARTTGILLTSSGTDMRKRILRMRYDLNDEIMHHVGIAGLTVGPADMKAVGEVLTARMRRLR